MPANYLVPVLGGLGTVVASVIGGFGAAKLKHKWDVADSDLRWKRERAQRRHDELRTALHDYLAARAEVLAAVMGWAVSGRIGPNLPDGERSERSNEIALLLAKLRRYREAVLILTEDNAAAKALDEDVEEIYQWMSDPPITLLDGQRMQVPTPSDELIRVTAHRLLEE